MMNDIVIDKKQQRYIIKKMINIAIRATYYIFRRRNRNWDRPDFIFNNPILSSICKLPIRSEIQKHKYKVSIIIIVNEDVAFKLVLVINSLSFFRLKKHYSSYEPTLVALKHKYEVI